MREKLIGFVQIAAVLVAAYSLFWGGREVRRMHQKIERTYQMSFQVEAVLQHLAGPIPSKQKDGTAGVLADKDGRPVTRLMLLEQMIVSAYGKSQ